MKNGSLLSTEYDFYAQWSQLQSTEENVIFLFQKLLTENSFLSRNRALWDFFSSVMSRVCSGLIRAITIAMYAYVHKHTHKMHMFIHAYMCKKFPRVFRFYSYKFSLYTILETPLMLANKPHYLSSILPYLIYNSKF